MTRTVTLLEADGSWIAGPVDGCAVGDNEVMVPANMSVCSRSNMDTFSGLPTVVYGKLCGVLSYNSFSLFKKVQKSGER
jgi:hypothetical protein